MATAKKETYKAAKARLLADLRANGWQVKEDLKVPHATSPNGKTRLWFKAQSVYYAFTSDRMIPPIMQNASSTWAEIRGATWQDLVRCAGVSP